LHGCSVHATCENTPGSWNCECEPGYEGDGTECTPASCANTIVLDPTTVIGGESISGSTVNTPNALHSGCGGATGGEVTYTIIPEISGILTVTTDFPGTNFDTVVSVRTLCEDGNTELGCDDNYAQPSAQLSWVATGGETYVVVVEGANGASGNFELAFTMCGDGVKDADEDCDGAADGCSDLCVLSKFISSKALDPSFSQMSWNQYGPGGGYHCANAVSYTCENNRPSRKDSAVAFCDCLDNIADAANKSIPGSSGQCPHHAQGNFWTSSGGHYRVATLGEITSNYDAGLNLIDEMVQGDSVWSCNRADGSNYGVNTMGHDKQIGTGGGAVYCGYPSYNQRYTVCVNTNFLEDAGSCGSRCAL
jgi:hypothetical protein